MNKTILYVMMLLTVATGVFAAVATINNPASGSITGAFNFNVTITGTTPSAFDNCTMDVFSSGTANSSYVSLGTLNNGTSAANTTENSNLNGSLSTSQVEDAADYSLRATCYNSTNASNTLVSAVVSSIIIDNTVPRLPTVSAPADDSTYTNGSIIFDVTVTGANTTSCTLTFVGTSPGTALSYAMTHTTGTCRSTAFTNVPSGIYRWYVQASDGTNLSGVSESQVDFQSSNKGKSLLLTPAQAQQATSGGTNNNTIAKVIVVGLIIYAVYTWKKK